MALKTILYPVTDLAKAKAQFSILFGVEPYVDQPYYVAFSADGQDVGLVPGGHQRGLTGATPYYFVDDIAKSVEALVGEGAALVEDAKDVGGGLLVAAVKDADGNMIGLAQQPS